MRLFILYLPQTYCELLNDLSTDVGRIPAARVMAQRWGFFVSWLQLKEEAKSQLASW